VCIRQLQMSRHAIALFCICTERASSVIVAGSAFSGSSGGA
jgi:hypothetical protein